VSVSTCSHVGQFRSLVANMRRIKPPFSSSSGQGGLKGISICLLSLCYSEPINLDPQGQGSERIYQGNEDSHLNLTWTHPDTSSLQAKCSCRDLRAGFPGPNPAKSE
jgi:hypothetical protein